MCRLYAPKLLTPVGLFDRWQMGGVFCFVLFLMLQITLTFYTLSSLMIVLLEKQFLKIICFSLVSCRSRKPQMYTDKCIQTNVYLMDYKNLKCFAVCDCMTGCYLTVFVFLLSFFYVQSYKRYSYFLLYIFFYFQVHRDITSI